MEDIIGPNQTAYIRNRQITDNLHLLQYATEKSVEHSENTMVVSLDAEKAFDSIEHWYIRALLKKIGLSHFLNTFDLIYRNQTVSIQLNKSCAGSYKIKNGVKQGDALSCILFILGIEPLIRNITNDNNVRGKSICGSTIPKIISYADDVACILYPSQDNLQHIFDHYQKMTNVSGLKLNAEKTELITCGVNTQHFEVWYNDKSYKITPCSDMKVNGLQIGFDLEEVQLKNFTKVITSVEQQLMGWSSRYLSLLGKILIFKTFGLSQILFVSTTTLFTKLQENKLINLIYKFLWNRDMNAKKAPDRIKRTILHSKIQNLGFGMLDFREIINSIRMKTVLRLLNNNTHPLHQILKINTSSSIINLINTKPIRPPIDAAIKLLNKRWAQVLSSAKSEQAPDLLKILTNEYIGNLVCRKFEKQRLVIKHKHDKLGEIIQHNRAHPVLHKIDKKYKNLLDFLQTPFVVSLDVRADVFPIKNILRPIHKITSRMLRDDSDNVPNPKLIINPNIEASIRLGKLISKMSNTRLKTTILRVIHGDVYSGTRLKKFGLSDSDTCPRCSVAETREHQIYECDYTRKLWHLASRITSIPNDSINSMLGYSPFHDKTTLTLHAELISRLLAIDRPQGDQIVMLRSALKKLGVVERGITKYQINQMITTLENLT